MRRYTLEQVTEELDRRGIRYFDTSDAKDDPSRVMRIVITDGKRWRSAIDGPGVYGFRLGLVEYWDSGLKEKHLDPVRITAEDCVRRFAEGLDGLEGRV